MHDTKLLILSLIVDANILISVLIRPGGYTASIFFDKRITLYAPLYLKEELLDHIHEMSSRSKLTLAEIKKAIEIICKHIIIVDPNIFENERRKGYKISPDYDDAEYMSLALHKGYPLWSNDKKLKQQASIEVLSTLEVKKLLLCKEQ